MKKLLMLALAATGCATTTPAAAPERATGPSACDYFPLAVGNTWVYDGPAEPGGARERIQIAITGMQDGFFLQSAGDPSKPSPIRCDAEGLRDPARVLLPAKIEQGEKWTAVVSVTDVEKFELVDVGSALNVPAGSYPNTLTTRATQRAHSAQHPNANIVNETTYAPGVGIVRIATRIEENGQVIPQIELVLRSYTPGPAAAAAPSR